MRKMKTEGQTTSGIENRQEEDEKQMETTGRDCPGQSWIENGGGRPMFLDEG